MKYCTNCGNELMDDQLFCPNCGETVEATNEQGIAPEESNGTSAEITYEKKQDKNLWAVIGMILGGVSILIGLLLFFSAARSYYDAGVYGADYYTEVASRLSSLANNLVETQQIIARGFGALLMALGGFDICYFGEKIKKK